MSVFASTRLDAVNTILRSVGETPVSNLDTQSGVDVEMALSTLDQVSREVQNVGWDFNSGTTTYQPDIDGRINLPGNILRFVGPRGTRYVTRAGLLHDRQAATSVWSGPVDLKVVELIDWEDLPETARAYITLSAARRFADRSLGDSELARYTRQDEQTAAFALRKEQLSVSRRRIFDYTTEAGIELGGPLDSYPG